MGQYIAPEVRCPDVQIDADLLIESDSVGVVKLWESMTREANVRVR